MSQVEILYLAWNRLEYTGLSWHMLMANTDWDIVRKLTVYDDGSEDGTLEYLREHIADCPVTAELRESDLRSPPAIMNHFLETRRAPFFAKIDNDILVPPGWLKAGMQVMRDEPALDLLGMEAGQCQEDPPADGRYRFEAARWIGGVGVMRTSAFKRHPSIPSRGRFGFTEWQTRYRLMRGWIAPDLNVLQLDRIPVEPWMTYTKRYIDNGWQRDWGFYPKESAHWWEWIHEFSEEAAE